ncbi:type II secretion system protein [Desulfonatronum thioautotrophicum]|uniref:type II secretion system protein n=1 Tax=Desulfonatronum thioautotrophicum TaxID=617001 RepID=UPI0005EB2850|nr:type II secretion system protein [Desulfonatronum thioautotrophicum]
MQNKGFTLLEVLIVIGIMGVIAAMVWPLRATLDDSQRERVTQEQIQVIRQAILGHDQVVDRLDRDRIVSGYVGDMREWPELWEPGGTGGAAGLGEDDRGAFIVDRFNWTRPYEEVKGSDRAAQSLGQPRGLWTRHVRDAATADIVDRPQQNQTWLGPYLSPPVAARRALGSQYATNNDEYEALNEEDRAYFHLLQGDGQLVDGWNRAFRFFLSKDPANPNSDDDEVFWIVSLGQDGRGDFPDDMSEYDKDAPQNRDNIVTMLYKSEWRELLRQIGRSSRFTERLVLLTQERIENQIVRALIGDSPAGANTGYTGDLLDWPELFNFVCRFDAEPEAYPCATICRVSHGPNGGDWRIITEIRNTEGDIVSGAYENEFGASITCTSGVCRDVDQIEVAFDCRLPEGRWDKEYGGDSFTAGQPRGLWDREALRPDQPEDGDPRFSRFGVGWRHAYIPKPNIGPIPAPSDKDEDEQLKDEFETALHFFKILDDDEIRQFLIASGGPSESIFLPIALNFGEDEDERRYYQYPEQQTGVMSISDEIAHVRQLLENRTERFELDEFLERSMSILEVRDAEDIVIATYENSDNITRLVRRNEWKPGFMDLEVILDMAEVNQESECVSLNNNIKCRMYGIPNADDWWDEKIFETQWDTEDGLCQAEPLRFKFDDKTPLEIISGGRYLVCWDSNERDPDTENHKLTPDPDDWNKIFSAFAHPARIVPTFVPWGISLKMSDFED